MGKKRRRMVDTSVPEHEDEVGPTRSKQRVQRKEQQARLDALAVALSELDPSRRHKLDLDPDLSAEVSLLESLGAGARGAFTRQRRRVAGLLREHDLDAMERRVEEAAGASAQADAFNHRLELLRRALVGEDGDEALGRLYEEHPHLDRQRLGQAVRAARSEVEAGAGQTGRRFKQLFQLLKELL